MSQNVVLIVLNTAFYHDKLSLRRPISVYPQEDIMLHNIDINKMNTLMENNKDVKQIINQLLANHHEAVSTITHEIRNPLTLVSSSLQVMEIHHPEIKEDPHWNQTVDDVHFMCQLLEDLSTLNNGDSLHYSVFSIEKLLKNIAISFAISLDGEDTAIEFTSSIIPGMRNFTGDKIKLQEVFLNLLRNAKESMNGSGRIDFTARQTFDRLTIECKDTGCGIPEDRLESVFDAFVTYKEGGTGLGLSLSKRIIEAHGGHISVESCVDTGTTFTIVLPI